MQAALMEELDSPWSQLVSTGNEEEVIPIVSEKLSIGRKSGELRFRIFINYFLVELQNWQTL